LKAHRKNREILMPVSLASFYRRSKGSTKIPLARVTRLCPGTRMKGFATLVCAVGADVLEPAVRIADDAPRENMTGEQMRGI
jgi:hypothetical protein